MIRHVRWYAAPMIVALAGAQLRPAAAQSLSLGVMAGASLSTFTGASLYDDAKQYAGFIAGGFVRLAAAGFAVQPGIYYTTKGVKSSDFSETTGSREKIDYIQIPVVLRLRLPMHLYAGAGPAIGFKLGCKISLASSSSTSADCPDTPTGLNAKSTEISGIAEAGIDLGKFSLGARADLGISNAFEAVNSGSTANVTVKTRTLSAVAAIRF